MKKPNIIRENVISFIQDFPRELNLDKYVDYDLQFEKSFVEPLKAILDAIGWNVEKTVNLELFFGWMMTKNSIISAMVTHYIKNFGRIKLTIALKLLMEKIEIAPRILLKFSLDSKLLDETCNLIKTQEKFFRCGTNQRTVDSFILRKKTIQKTY